MDAQDPVYLLVLDELRAGRKTTHWMWFIFPQIAGLGASTTSRFYALENADEARAYLAHDVLGQRLRDCAELLLSLQGRSAHEIFGSPDDLKLRSCMTLFASVSPQKSVFHQVLDRYYGGIADEKTLAVLGSTPS